MIVATTIGVIALSIFGTLIWLIVDSTRKQAVANLTAKLEHDALLKLNKANEIAVAVNPVDSAERRLRDGSF